MCRLCAASSRDNEGYTPLMLCAKAKNPELVRMLLETMANPLLTNDVGHTARDIAEARGSLECASILREYEVSHSGPSGGECSSTVAVCVCMRRVSVPV